MTGPTAIALSKVLVQNNTLKSINLSCNNLGVVSELLFIDPCYQEGDKSKVLPEGGAREKAMLSSILKGPVKLNMAQISLVKHVICLTPAAFGLRCSLG